jgi:hypothetical protein
MNTIYSPKKYANYTFENIMKKSLINIGILLFIDFLLIYDFLFGGTIDGVSIPKLDYYTEWKSDAGEVFLILGITFLLLREIVKLVLGRKNDN